MDVAIRLRHCRYCAPESNAGPAGSRAFDAAGDCPAGGENLLAAQGIPNHGIASQLGVSRPTVLLWRKRFEEGGHDALAEIKEGRGRKPAIAGRTLEQIVEDTLHTVPPDATHWSTR